MRVPAQSKAEPWGVCGGYHDAATTVVSVRRPRSYYDYPTSSAATYTPAAEVFRCYYRLTAAHIIASSLCRSSSSIIVYRSTVVSAYASLACDVSSSDQRRPGCRYQVFRFRDEHRLPMLRTGPAEGGMGTPGLLLRASCQAPPPWPFQACESRSASDQMLEKDERTCCVDSWEKDETPAPRLCRRPWLPSPFSGGNPRVAGRISRQSRFRCDAH